MTGTESLLAPMPRAERRDMAGVEVDILRAGDHQYAIVALLGAILLLGVVLVAGVRLTP